MLAAENRERIRWFFGCTVADNYGCPEFIALAVGCQVVPVLPLAIWAVIKEPPMRDPKSSKFRHIWAE